MLDECVHAPLPPQTEHNTPRFKGSTARGRCGDSIGCTKGHTHSFVLPAGLGILGFKIRHIQDIIQSSQETANRKFGKVTLLTINGKGRISLQVRQTRKTVCHCSLARHFSCHRRQKLRFSWRLRVSRVSAYTWRLQSLLKSPGAVMPPPGNCPSTYPFLLLITTNPPTVFLVFRVRPDLSPPQ